MTSRVLCRVNRLLEQAAATRPVLGLDTSTSIASLAIVAGGKVVASLERPVTSHGASLPGTLDDLLRTAGLKIADLAAIAVGTGPGSFTGLRIGISYAKGIAMATRCALVGISGFDAIASATLERHNIGPDRQLCVVVDARKGEVYTALYGTVSDGLKKLSEESVVALDHLASHIADDLTFVGDDRAKDAAALVESRGFRVAVFNIGELDLRGACVAALGGARFALGEMDRAASLEPLYIRTPEATFKPTSKSPAGMSMEGVWSIERKNSFGSI
jgi:tRNA threonylcarbamoyladenosine biosynthesis protein TsaB